VKISTLELARGLLLLGLFALALSAAALALDWAAFEDRSNTATAALGGSLVLLALGGWLGRCPRAAVQHALAGALLAGVFLTLACLFSRYRNPHFFPGRSRTLLELAALVSVLAALALYLVNRIGPGHEPHASRGRR
jgi:hypothetical protein